MNAEKFYSNILKDFKFTPTADQNVALKLLSKYLTAEDNEQIFLLRGYAGTGKTTIISTIVKNLPILRLKSSLNAPTGRAAKVMKNYSGKPEYKAPELIKFYFEN